MKKFMLFFAMVTLLFTLSACSSNNDKSDHDKDPAATAELEQSTKSKMYNSVRIAELKVKEVFHKDAAEDGTPVMNPHFAQDNKAVDFLSTFYSQDIAEDIYTHYATEETTADGKMILNAAPYFDPSFLDTKIEDVTIEGNENKATVVTESRTYEVELQDERYVITGIQQK